MTHPLRKSLGDPIWVFANLERLQQVFPEQWVPLGLLDAFAVGHQLKAIGVDWNGEKEMTEVFGFLITLGILRLGWTESTPPVRVCCRGALLPIKPDGPPLGYRH